jgi:hypothetical protein
MIYIFDTCALIVIFDYYYRERFPTFWNRFGEAREALSILSVREVKNEIHDYASRGVLKEWADDNDDFFTMPSIEEMNFIAEIYAVRHFQQNIEREKMLKGKAVADPFVIAKAKIDGGTVVTQEKFKDHAAKIPNICKHFDVRCLSLEGFMIEVDWKF